MKKITKILLLVFVTVIMLLVLTGCESENATQIKINNSFIANMDCTQSIVGPECGTRNTNVPHSAVAGNEF